MKTLWLAQTMRLEADGGDRMGKFDLHRLGEEGQTMVEFAFAVPVLLLILVGIVVFGLAFNNYLTLTFAANAGAQQVSISRAPGVDPCAIASQAVENAAPTLNPGSLTFSIAMGSGSPVTYGAPYKGTSCTSATLVQSQTAQVTVTYPLNLTVMGYNFAPSGTVLTAQTAMLIQ